MKQNIDYTPQLKKYMAKVGINSPRELSRKAGVADIHIIRLCRGLALQTTAEVLLKITEALQIPITELLITFTPASILTKSAELSSIDKEYQRLELEKAQLQKSITQDVQQSTLQILESWLLQWPTVVQKVQDNPGLLASKILPILRPLERLMEEWGIEMIAPIGSQVSYDPQWHQLMDGEANIGDPVTVRYAGYKQGDKLIYRTQVTPH
ncbi:MAG: helix-turn-helix domain-containing protein [Microcoleaceae cyanobacterium]